MTKDHSHGERATCCASRNDLADTDDIVKHIYNLPLSTPQKQAEVRSNMIVIPGGFFDMGTNKPNYLGDFEGPVQKIFVSRFLISPYAVTNSQYKTFVDNTGYKTVAEAEGWSYVFHLFLDDIVEYPNFSAGTPWWRQVHGAYWAAPEGPASDITGRGDHPVTHVSWIDAQAYCTWAGVRLLTEAEWEKAARAGLTHKKYPWGNELTPNNEHRCNIWQGIFPHNNTSDDGYIGTAPVDAYQPNKFGLYNMTGNVWEWCTDWFGRNEAVGRLPLRDPKGPEAGDAKILRGGSHLCHESYCIRYHVHSRSKNTPDSSSGNTGFRVAADIEA